MELKELKALAEGLFLEDYAEKQKELLNKKLENEALVRAYSNVFSTPDGRKVFWDMLSHCGIFNLSMTGNSWTYFNEGKRQTGLYLLTMLKLGNSIEDISKIESMNPKEV